MSTRRTSAAMLGLVAVLGGACDAVLSIRDLDSTGPADAGEPRAGIDATLAGDATTDGSAEGNRVSSGSQDAAPVDTGLADAPVLVFGNPACTACASTSCASEADACAGDSVCGPYQNCLGACNGVPGCRSQCTVANLISSPFTPAVSALSACLALNCETACNLKCGGFAAYLSEPDAAAACETCLYMSSSPFVTMNACADSYDCASSVDCDAYWRCYMACPTPDCKFSCALGHEAGVSLFRAVQSDYAGTCSGPCQYGNYWACVGHVGWPAKLSNVVALTVPVVDFLAQGTPVPGETVSVCANCPCGSAMSADPLLGEAGTTDDAGLVTVQVTQPSNPENWGLNGCVQVTSATDATVPYYGYWGYPLSEPVVNPALGPGLYSANIAAQSAQVFTPAELVSATGYLNQTVLPDTGMIGASVFDCLDNPASGVRVALSPSDPSVTPFYSLSGDAGATTYTGYAFFFNVPPSNGYQLTAMPGPLDGGASSVVIVDVAANTTTAAGMFPTPPVTVFPSH